MYLLKLSWFEFKLLMKERVGAIWTFLFPLILLVALVPIYENVDQMRQGKGALVVDVCGEPDQTRALVERLEPYIAGEVNWTAHESPEFLSYGYRIDLSSDCLYLPDGDSTAQISRFHRSPVHDGVVEHVVHGFLSDAPTPELRVRDYSRAERRLPSAQFLLSGILAITLTSTVLFGVAVSLVGMRSANILKKYRLFPVRNIEIFGSLMLSRLLLMLAFCVFFVVFGFWYFDFSYASMDLPKTVLLTLTTLLVFISVSIALANGFSTQAGISPVVSLLYIGTIMIGNIFFPTHMLPDWIATASEYYPVRVFADTFRQEAFGVDMGVEFSRSMLILLVWGIVSAILAVKFFRWHSYRN